MVLHTKLDIDKFLEEEFEILAATTPDAIILPFEKEILALCEAFGNSGQSGGSAPYTAKALARSIEELLLHKPISPITGQEDEWRGDDEDDSFQNRRCAAVFKKGINGKPYCLDAIVWKGEKYAFSGKVYVDDKNFELIGSTQYIKLPFTPKTFYIDVVRVPITEEEAVVKGIMYSKMRDGSCYYTVVKNPKQLKKVFKYYEMKK